MSRGTCTWSWGPLTSEVASAPWQAGGRAEPFEASKAPAALDVWDPLRGKAKRTMIREADAGKECAGGKAGGAGCSSVGGPGVGDERGSLSENLAPGDEWGVREESGKG